MLAFIVRPFGTRRDIDFDRVEQELIGPVLDGLAIQGRTTQEIARAGNIRTDMFERLLLADLVIADVSIHNANVYYELGVRHALRPRTTILIRARGDDVPFDLRTDRYLEYSADDPGGARELLAAAIRQSVVADNVDSPVFALLPALRPTDPDELRPVPESFSEDVRRAEQVRDLPLLSVLGQEAEGFEWWLAGARVVGRAQFELSAWADARATWESIRDKRPDDAEADLRLATVYQRLGDAAASNAAVERVLERPGISDTDRAEALALKGRNAKDAWVADWRDRPAPERPAAALASPALTDARLSYHDAFLADQNHWYSGINALALTVVTVHLATREPGTWDVQYDSSEDAQTVLHDLRIRWGRLDGAVRHSLDAHAFRNRQRGDYDVWVDLGRADVRLLADGSEPRRVAGAYARARERMAQESTATFPAESAARQIRTYLDLGVFAEAGEAALEALGAAREDPEPPVRSRIVVFAGHRIDAPDREQPRFPAASEDRAAGMIRAALEGELALAGDRPIEGIAGGASGGDILFHELAGELGVHTSLLLALPRDRFAAESVVDAGPDWMERFRALCETLDTKVLAETAELPDWLARRDGYTIWERNNLWMLHNALSRSDADVTLIVLWDGKGGDGPGGTADMVRLAESRGVRVVRLDAARLL
jgi:Tetratricopeptide Repeats-Sensor